MTAALPVSDALDARGSVASSVRDRETFGEHALTRAQSDGLAANVRTMLSFVGVDGIVEVQGLKVRRRDGDTFTLTRAAHARSAAELVTLASTADAWNAAGLYVLPAALKPGVETRHHTPGEWFDVPQKSGTTDSDIARRRVLAVDLDVVRPSSISATDAEMALSVEVASRAWPLLAELTREAALALVHSGNGRQIWIALDCPATDAVRVLCASVLAGLDALLSTPAVRVDVSLSDAKRILPLCGTMKKKGAPGVPERPHRRTAIVAPANPSRLDETALAQLVARIRERCDENGRAAIDRASGVRGAKPRNATRAAPRATTDVDPFAEANALDPVRVAEALDLYESGELRCPGCGESQGVDVIDHGLKCLHNRCASKGRGGFRTNLDLVIEVRGGNVREAHEWLAERFALAPLRAAGSPTTNGAAHHEAWRDGPPAGFGESDPGATDPERAAAPMSPIASRIVTVDTSWLSTVPPAREYLARDTRTGRGALDARGVCLLVAAGGVGKSFVTLGLAFAIATGTPWQGMFAFERPGRVLFVSGEEPADEIRHRGYHVARCSRIASVPADSIDVIDLHDVHVPLLDAEVRTTEHAAALVEVARTRGPYALVIIDPLARFAGAPIDADNVAAGALIGVLESISTAANGLVLGLHHTDKGSRRAGVVDATSIRGATGLGDSARMVMTLAVERIDHDDAEVDGRLGEIVTLACAKANHVRKWEPIALRRGEHGELAALDATDRAMVDAARRSASPSTARREAREVERKARDAADEARRTRRADDEGGRCAREDEAVIAAVSERPGIGVRDLRAAVRAKVGCGAERATVAIERMRARLSVEIGPRGAHRMSLAAGGAP